MALASTETHGMVKVSDSAPRVNPHGSNEK